MKRTGFGIEHEQFRESVRRFLKVEALPLVQESSSQSLITVTAHRDELLELQQALQLKPTE